MAFVSFSKDELVDLVEVIDSQTFVVEARLEFAVDEADESVVDRYEKCQSSV